MTEFKVGDLVRIVKQSPTINSHISMVGLNGFIEEIQGDVAQFMELNERGYGGMGGVPLSCLELQNDNKTLRSYKEIRDKRIEDSLNAALAYNQRYQEEKYRLMNKAAMETGVSIRNVMRIFDICKEFENEWNR